MFIVTRIWISISDLDLNSIIESHNENLKNLVNFIIIIINTTEQSSWAPTSHVLVVNCEATKATISATIKAIPVHRYPLSPFEL